MDESRAALLSRAVRADNEGDLVAAIALIEEAIRLSPEDARSRTWLGGLYARREQFAAALAMLETSIAIDPMHARSHAALAEVLCDLGRWKEAERAARESIALKLSPPSLVILGCALSAQGRSDEAEQVFRRALELEPENEEAIYNLALETQHRDPAATLALLRSAIRIDPRYSDAHRELGFQLAKCLDFTHAEEEILESIDLNPSDALAYVYLANVLASTDRVDRAESMLRRASELSPLLALPLWGLGKLRELKGRNDEALSLFQEAVAVEPHNAEALFQFARFLLDQGHRTEGLDFLEEALRHTPQHEEALRLRRKWAY